jgi:hypothetical protein
MLFFSLNLTSTPLKTKTANSCLFSLKHIEINNATEKQAYKKSMKNNVEK